MPLFTPAFAGNAAGPFVCDAAQFNGTNTRLARGGALTGALPSKKGTLSLCVKFTGSDGTVQPIISEPNGWFQLSRQADNTMLFTASTSGSITVVSLVTTTTITASSGWTNHVITWNTEVSDNYFWYVNAIDRADPSAVLMNAAVGYSSFTNLYIGTDSTGSTTYANVSLAEVWFTAGVYVGSVNAPYFFYNATTGKPRYLGVNGSSPLRGTAPTVYLHLDDGESASAFATNRGSGGSFTASGTLNTASTSPTD